nr:DNA cytosine methyltransferase [uncultured Flavobacterium sp.]
MENKIKVVELFAGVGGFRVGLEGWNGKSSLSNYTKSLKSKYEVVWNNQWEPSTKSSMLQWCMQIVSVKTTTFMKILQT